LKILKQKYANAFGGTFAFLQTHKAKQKKQKSHQAIAPRHRKQWTTEQRQKERQQVTAPTQKAGFRVPKTVLRLIKH